MNQPTTTNGASAATCPKCHRPMHPERPFRPGDCYHALQPEKSPASDVEPSTEVRRLRAELDLLKLENTKSHEEREIEQAIVSAELEIHRLTNRLRGFGAPQSAFHRELSIPTKQLYDAVEKLAALRETSVPTGRTRPAHTCQSGRHWCVACAAIFRRWDTAPVVKR